MINYKLDELVRVAKRDNNSIRPYLYVSPLQGKHLSVEPNKSLTLFREMARLLEDNYPDEKILVIGFAETATAIGAAVAYFGSNVFFITQTTREDLELADYLYFTESHSHAKEQGLIINRYSEVLKSVDRIVFAEDEVTTGNTIMKLVETIKRAFPTYKLKYTILCILNSMKETRLLELAQQGIDCIYISQMAFEYKINELGRYEYKNIEALQAVEYSDHYDEMIVHKKCDMRTIKPKNEYIEACNEFSNTVLSQLAIKEEYKKILVLGTEEFMFLPMYLAKQIQDKYRQSIVKFHATTRSPILISEDQRYPLFNRHELSSFYDEDRITYIYNLEKYDYVIVITDSEKSTNAGKQLTRALETEGNQNIQIVRWCK